MKSCPVPGDEAAPCVLGNLVSSTGVVQNDLREYIVRSAAHPEVQVVLDLAGEDVGVRGPVVCVQVGSAGFRPPTYTVFKYRRKLPQGLKQILFVKHIRQSLRCP